MEEEADFFVLDEGRLDEEWINQPKLYHRYKVALADARKVHEQAKAARDVTAAEVDRSVRLNPGQFGLEKLTEPSIEKAILISKKYQSANRAVIDAKHAVDVLEAAVDTLEHRKKALENLVQLWLANYFSKMKTPKDVPQEKLDELQMRARRKRREGA